MQSDETLSLLLNNHTADLFLMYTTLLPALTSTKLGMVSFSEVVLLVYVGIPVSAIFSF